MTIFIIRLIRHKGCGLNYQGYGHIQTGKAIEILNERYAKGEVSDEEYQKIKTEITKV